MSKRNTKPIDECPPFSTPEELEALSPEDQERVDKYYSREIPLSETRALTPAERAQFDRAVGRKPGARMGRPKIGQGAKVVAVTLEKGFLQRVDQYAKKHKLKRAQLIVQGLRMAIGDAPAADKPRQRKSA